MQSLGYMDGLLHVVLMTQVSGNPGRVERFRPHAKRILVAWIFSCAVAIPLIVLVLGPHLPPGDMTQGGVLEQTSTNIVMTASLRTDRAPDRASISPTRSSSSGRGAATLEDGAPG